MQNDYKTVQKQLNKYLGAQIYTKTEQRKFNRQTG